LGTLRIIAGSLRGRRIKVPDGQEVRPTSDRVREALFGILGPSVEGLRVLDPYAGSGALGFEALSRGAVAATFLESNRDVLRVLHANAAALGVEDRCTFHAGRATGLLEKGTARGPFDLVLADPPYRDPEARRFLDALGRPGLLAPGARVVLERDRGTPEEVPSRAGLTLSRTARYGRTCLDFYSWRGEPAPG
jgi:16S rRNA (guanine966-N2)-methyltransferase